MRLWRARLDICDNRKQMKGATIFVYGTLKRGCRNHLLLQAAEFLGEARTEAGYLLVDCGGYPGLVGAGLVRMELAPSEIGSGVFGELYKVDDELLAVLDRFEDVPNEYERVVIQLSDGRKAEGYLYRGPVADLPLCGPVWREG
jgi:gamma-glutamylcyclotransferase (GGCT)/AIG2-like uncharacterized protein YtfP